MTSATAGTISNVAPAAIAGVAQPARLRFQSDLSRVKAELTNLLALLGGGNLTALAGLDGTGGNWLPYLTAAGLMARTALTPFARTLLDDASATDALNTLNVIGSNQAMRLPGGAILQWNSIVQTTWDSNGEALVPLISAYSSATSYTVLAGYSSGGTAGTNQVGICFAFNGAGKTNALFPIRQFNMGTGAPIASGGRRIEWVAVGY